MKRYLSHYSAAEFWNIPYVETVLGSKITESKEVHFTVSRRNTMWETKGHKIHWCRVSLPASAVLSKNGIAVASPELVFLQFACKLSMHQLILLGLQLCSHPPGNPLATITTKQKLNAFITKTPGYQGRRKALRAIKYIENGSASIMESMVYMILTLPHSLGGYGFSGANFNYEIKLNDEAGKLLGQKRCFTDLYYKSAKLAIEYDSFSFHNSPSSQGKDSIRSAILHRHGIEVMHFTTIQLYNERACTDFAFNLASRLGKRMQIRTKKFDEMNQLLRALLPAQKPIGIDVKDL